MNAILLWFGCPLTIVINQGVHFINDVIKHFTDHFLLKHMSATIYYPQWNVHAKSTNKVFGTLLTKLVNDNKTNWDEHLPIVLFSYRITYKVAIGYTPYQLVYGLHPLMLTEYILLIMGSDHKKGNLMKVLTSRVSKLEKL
jgi:hypothetical protein